MAETSKPGSTREFGAPHPLGYRSRLDLDHDARFEETRDTEECAYRLAPRLCKDRHHLASFRHEPIDICCIEIQPHDILGFHVRRGEDLDQILPGELKLRNEIARVHRGAARVVRGLTGHIKHALAGRDLDRLIDIKGAEPRLGIDRTNLHENDLLREM